MSKTKIEWSQYTWSPIRGCTPVSAGCDNCYAEKMAKRFKPCKTCKVIRFDCSGKLGECDSYFKPTMIPERLNEPLRWKKPRMVFVGSMGDLFHDDISDVFVTKIFQIMAMTPRHTYQILTKRPQRMNKFINNLESDDQWLRFTDELELLPTLENVWLGVTAENQQTADERIPLLLQTPAALRFISCEPLLENIELSPEVIGGYPSSEEWARTGPKKPRLDWVIVGGETGPGARECKEGWVQGI
jgi:protein gp37